MKMIHLKILCLSVFLINSCANNAEKNSSEIENLKAEEQKIDKDRRKQEKKYKVEELSKKYKISYKLDTLLPEYSIQYEPIIKSGHVIVEKFYLNDIFQKDSTYYISIWTGNIRSLTMPVSKEIIDDLLDKKLENVLVVSIDEVKKINIEIDGQNKDGESVDLMLDNSYNFLATGKLIEILSIKK